MAKKLTTSEFVKKSKQVHGYKYDYSKSKYLTSRQKIIIICPEHGSFNQKANTHLQGSGCPHCGIKNYSTTKEFIKKANNVHDNKYCYSKTNYVDAHKKVTITCKEHGDFEQVPNSHLQGNGCSKCAKNYKYTNREFIEKANKIHNYKYDYVLSKYVKTYIKLKIICKKHGVFEQTPNQHLSGSGCRKCGIIKRSEKKSDSKQDFIEKAEKVHENKYLYNKVEYINSKTGINITCKKHGYFNQLPNSHIRGSGCPKCWFESSTSKAERDIFKFINFNVIAEKSDRTVLKDKELDIYVPSKKLAIEFNGLYWHSDKIVHKNYHLDKTLECQKKGVQLIHIFEDEWFHKKNIVKSRLSNLLNLTKNRIFARKCNIKIVDTKEKTRFLKDNHIQGAVGSSINLGLYYNNKLVSIMTFGVLRKNLGSKNKENSWELLRFCNKLNTSVVGGFSKLLKHFQKNYNYKEIISYADLRWSKGNVYKKNGFTEIHRSKPNYFYTKGLKRENRFKYRKSELIKWDWGTEHQTEKEIMEQKRFNRIYDCGTIKYALTKK